MLVGFLREDFLREDFLREDFFCEDFFCEDLRWDFFLAAKRGVLISEAPNCNLALLRDDLLRLFRLGVAVLLLEILRFLV
jgi:hypothetical protein